MKSQPERLARTMGPKLDANASDALAPVHGGVRRRTFLTGLVVGSSAVAFGCVTKKATLTSVTGTLPTMGGAAARVDVLDARAGDDVFSYIQRMRGQFDIELYRQLLGAANAFKEGDEAQGVAARDDESRQNARRLLENTTIGDIDRHAIFDDEVEAFAARSIDPKVAASIASWTLGELQGRLLHEPVQEVKRIMPGLSSDIIACVVKLMSNDELIRVGQRVFNPLPGSNIGAQGYMGARIQPNSPTDHVDDITWQVFDGFSYAVGDVVLGTNPVSSEVESVLAVENALADIIRTFDLETIMPHCVLSHIDVQAQVEDRQPGSTALWFQSLGGVTDANTTFDVTVDKMVAHAARRTGQYGLYFETGQGADATNGHGKGFDMVIHESRKYGFARTLVALVGDAQVRAGRSRAPWVHVNDVAGFIGPEVFRTREQLVRCCLEDTVMGKLHGLTIGLDICSTLHMDVDLDDLDWCMNQVMPANPAYLMALPTKSDPMLSYLTTGFQDHVRLRHEFGYKVEDRMWRFFQSLGVIDERGQPTEHFGQPTWVYLQYARKKGDTRPDDEILAEGKQAIAEVRARGVFIAEGYGDHPWQLEPKLAERVRYLYEDSKNSIRAELPADFERTLPGAVVVHTRSKNRDDYILHPPTGERLTAAGAAEIARLRERHGGRYEVQIIISDGLNAFAITDEGHLAPYLRDVTTALSTAGYKVAPEPIVVRSGRVRAGYRIGEMLYGSYTDKSTHKAVLHIIGERPGSGHHAFSVYITAPPVHTWAKPGMVDHNITKVVSGIADTALAPARAVVSTIAILKQLAPR